MDGVTKSERLFLRAKKAINAITRDRETPCEHREAWLEQIEDLIKKRLDYLNDLPPDEDEDWDDHDPSDNDVQLDNSIDEYFGNITGHHY